VDFIVRCQNEDGGFGLYENMESHGTIVLNKINF